MATKLIKIVHYVDVERIDNLGDVALAAMARRALRNAIAQQIAKNNEAAEKLAEHNRKLMELDDKLYSFWR